MKPAPEEHLCIDDLSVAHPVPGLLVLVTSSCNEATGIAATAAAVEVVEDDRDRQQRGVAQAMSAEILHKHFLLLLHLRLLL